MTKLRSDVCQLIASADFPLDIGGEGRHALAWNLNPSPVKTIGTDRGAPIPRLILGRAESIPLSAGSVDLVIVERTPLKVTALCEIRRVISHGGIIVLRHAVPPNFDPHCIAYKHLARSRVTQCRIWRNKYWLQQTIFR